MSTISNNAVVMNLLRSGLVTFLFAVYALTPIASSSAGAATPAVGDTYVYRVLNGYNNEPRRQASYKVEKVETDRTVVGVVVDISGQQFTGTVIYTPDGSWLRYPISSHDQFMNYEFSAALPVYDFPLTTGKEWSKRVDAVTIGNGARRSVRIDAIVRGPEKIKTPAGEFDTIKITRTIYAGDADFDNSETAVIENDWYAPALGRSVRVSSSSGWRNLTTSARLSAMRGDWDIYELVSAPAAH